MVIPSILITRWNGKEIANEKRKQAGIKIAEEDHDELQSNLTEKLLRTFRRLEHHHSGINTSSYPYESDSSMHMTLDSTSICNNGLLDETYNLGVNQIKKIK